MTRRLISLLVGVGVVVFFVVLQSLENWIFLKHATEVLRDAGPFGSAIASLLMSRITPLVIALFVVGIAVEMWLKHREKTPAEVGDTVAPTPSVANSSNSSSSAIGNSVVVNFLAPFPTPGPPPGRFEEESLPVDVEFKPLQGQSTKMFLAVKNRGRKQFFEAQCRVVAIRNTSCPLSTYNLSWEDGGGEHELKTGEWGNLLIASADEDRASELEWIRLESSAKNTKLPECRWTPGGKSIPEFDLEITVLGQQSNAPQVERFTLRAGRGNQAIEMFKRFVLILSPPERTGVGHLLQLFHNTGHVSHLVDSLCAWTHLSPSPS